MGDRFVPWREVRRVIAYKRDTYVGDCLCLAIVGAGGQPIEINEGSPGWEMAGKGIEEFVPGSMPRAKWTVALIAASPGAPVSIYPA